MLGKISLDKRQDCNIKELKDTQIEIESMTIRYDEKTIFKSYPEMVKLLMGKESDSPYISVKDYLKQKKKSLSDDDLDLISDLGQFTLEAIIIHVLGSVFNCVDTSRPSVRVATLVDQLDSNVRVHATARRY